MVAPKRDWRAQELTVTDRDEARGDNEERQESAPIPLLIVSWLVPGAGHLILGRKLQAAIFATVVVAGWTTGILLGGELAVPRSGSPFSWLSTFACLGDGVLYLLGRLLSVGAGEPTAPGFSYGNTFLVTSGLMNLLLVLDVSDIATHKKA